MSNPTQANLGLGPILPLYDNAGNQTNVAARAKNVSTDADGVVSGDIGVDVEVTIADVKMEGDYTEMAGLSAGADNADLVPSTDVSTYRWFALQVTGTWAGTLTFAGSNDGITFYVIPAYSVSSGVVNTATANGLWWGICAFRYLRVRMHPYTSGTADGILELYTVAPPQLATTTNTFSTGGSVGLSAGSSLIGGVNVQQIGGQAPTLDNTTILAVSNRGKNSVAGDTPIACDASGNLYVNLLNTTGNPTLGAINLRMSGAQVSVTNPLAVAQQGGSNTAIAAGTSADTVIKASAGRCCFILVTALGTNGMLVWDNASGHTGTIIAALPASAPVGLYGPYFPTANGVTVQGNAANPAVTINWA